jgi:hypothetical protein
MLRMLTDSSALLKTEQFRQLQRQQKLQSGQAVAAAAAER